MGAEWGRLPLRAVLAVALLVVGSAAACAGGSSDGPTVLSTMDEELEFEEPDRKQVVPSGPVHIPYREPDKGGTAYRIVLEVSGEWFVVTPGDPQDKPPLSESHLLELEYREFPTDAGDTDRQAYLLGLDAIHYKLLQQNPHALREIELGSDRLRVFRDGEEVMDLQGAQPRGDLTPQKLLGHIFGVLVHDQFGNPQALVPRGVPVVRAFLENLLVKPAIGYSRLSLPQAEITPGAQWHARRFPASRSGELGLSLDVEYSLVAYEELDGVLCAFIQLRASEDAEDVESASGLLFDRVLAKMSGSAWVELETSRVRRLVLEDEVRMAMSRGQAPMIQKTRMRHATRMMFELRDPEVVPETWADGTTRFGKR